MAKLGASGVANHLVAGSATIALSHLMSVAELPSLSDAPPYVRYRLQDANDITVYSDSTEWRVDGGRGVLFQSKLPQKVTWPAATFTGLSYSNSGGKVLLSSSGAHGLTTGSALAGVSLQVSFTGWSATGLYSILSVPSSTTVLIDLAYSTIYGTPSAVLVGGDITLLSVLIPGGLLGTYGVFENYNAVRISGSSGSRSFKAYLNGNMMWTQDSSAAMVSHTNAIGFFNRGAANSQLARLPQYSFGFGHTSATFASSSVDTTVDSTWVFAVSNNVAGETVTLENALCYLVK